MPQRIVLNTFLFGILCFHGGLCGNPTLVAQDSTLPIGLEIYRQVDADDFPGALESLARANSVDTTRSDMDENRVSLGAATLYRVLAQLSPDERYELLYRWTMPVEGRSEIRSVFTIVPSQAPPKAFARAIGERAKDSTFAVASIGHVRGIFSTRWILINAANEIGRLSGLITELEKLTGEKVRGAEPFLLLARIASTRSDTDALNKTLQAKTQFIKKDGPTLKASVDPFHFLLPIAATTRPELAADAAKLMEAVFEAPARPRNRAMPYLRIAHALALQTSLGKSEPVSILHRPMKHWVAASGMTSWYHQRGWHDPLWFSFEDHIMRLSGIDNTTLMCRYPLQGDFVFRCEALGGGREQVRGGLIYGGLQFEGGVNDRVVRIGDSDTKNVLERKCPFIRSQPQSVFNTLAIESSEKDYALLVNGSAMWVDSLGGNTSPWIGLKGFGHGKTYFRNLTLEGTPTIPREVALLTKNEMRGWQSRFFGESQPPFSGDPVSDVSETQTDVSQSPFWTFEDGEVRAAKVVAESDNRTECLLRYHRPLLEGETIDYEFYYQSDEFIVHPTLGRLSFLIQPKGVEVRWITDGYSDWTGLKPDHTLLEPLNRRGPRPLPLKEKEWNKMRVSRENGKILIALNGESIYQRKMETDAVEPFGFYLNPKLSGARIRNAVLSGDWPKTPPDDFLSDPGT